MVYVLRPQRMPCFMIPDLDEPDEATRALCEGVFPSLSELRTHFVKIL